MIEQTQNIIPYQFFIIMGIGISMGLILSGIILLLKRFGK